MIAPTPFHKKWITIGAIKEPVYSKTAVIKRLIVMTLSTGRIPASNAPPCANVNKPVDTIIAAAMLPLLFIIWYK